MQQDFDFFAARDYRLILKKHFELKKSNRPAYSLGAFARDIGLTNSRLNAILKAKHGISKTTAETIAKKLNFTKDQIAFFAALAESQHARTELERKQAFARLGRFIKTVEHTIDGEQIHILEKWYYPAALHLVKSKQGQTSVDRLSQALRISKVEAQSTLDLLVHQGELKKSEKGYEYSPSFKTAKSVAPSKTIQNFHAQFLDQLKDSIFREPMLKRKNRSTYLTFDSSRIEEARIWLERMHSEFLNEFGIEDKGDSVYSLGVYFSRIDQEVKQ